MSKIKACPFCGSQGQTMDWYPLGKAITQYGCQPCNFWTNNLERWNTRATPADQDAPILTRDFLGELVRDAWVKWAKQQPNPKPSWLVPYWELNEADKEADRQIGEAVWNWAFRVKGAMLERATPADQKPIYQVRYFGSGDWRDVSEAEYQHARMHPDMRDRIVYAQPPQNAADHIEAQSVRDAEVADLRKLVSELQKALFFWMPSIAGQETSDGERAANDAYLLYGWTVGDEENCYGDRARNAVIEECAMVCDAQGCKWFDQGEEDRGTAGFWLREELRLLKSAPPQKPVSDEVKP